MGMNKIFGGTISLLEKVLNFRAQRQNLLVSNIANVDTPYYKSVDINFENQLKRVVEDNSQLRKTNINHFPGSIKSIDEIKPDIIYNPNVSLREDSNTVDIDHEMTKLAENNLMYNASAQMLSKLLLLIKHSIEGERR